MKAQSLLCLPLFLAPVGANGQGFACGTTEEALVEALGPYSSRAVSRNRVTLAYMAGGNARIFILDTESGLERVRENGVSVLDCPRPGSEPHFTRYTKPPVLQNEKEAVQAVESRYPDELEHRGIGGTVIVWIFVDAEGAVRNARVRESSGNEKLDRAAVAAARKFEYEPALDGDEEVAVWISIPISFSVR